MRSEDFEDVVGDLKGKEVGRWLTLFRGKNSNQVPPKKMVIRGMTSLIVTQHTVDFEGRLFRKNMFVFSRPSGVPNQHIGTLVKLGADGSKVGLITYSGPRQAIHKHLIPFSRRQEIIIPRCYHYGMKNS